ncbi:dethiobiotin synthase [Pasteurellaceae bacterium LIM206]|nr:dethiobiotin synthase [Pasteurellaceae bacterium LIM206]
MSAFFITGTDTNVGKTIASRAIMQAMQQAGIQIVGYKPLAAGQDEAVYATALEEQTDDYGAADNPDVRILLNSTLESVTYKEINSYTFAHTMPMLTQEGKRISVDKINADLHRLSSKYQSVLVEGTFGWLSPLTREKMFGEWVVEQNMPVVLVVGIKEGCMNHALLTAQSIQSMGLPLLGWIANRINPFLSHYAEIINQLTKQIDAPLLGKIPYVHKPEEQELGHYITGIDRLTFMKTEFVV